MNKPVYLDLSISELSKIVMYEFSYEYVKTKYEEKAKLCYIDTGSFTVNVKADDIYKYIAKNIETRFNTSNQELDRSLPNGKSKKVIALMKDEGSGKIMKEVAALRGKTYSYPNTTKMKIRKLKAQKKVCDQKKI